MSEHFDSKLYCCGLYQREHEKFQKYVREALHTGMTFQEYLSDLETKVKVASARLKKLKDEEKINESC